MNRPRQDQSGFTLVELVIVLIVAGVLLSGIVMLAGPILRQAHVTQTNAKLANIARALDFYATQNNRVPCPAFPDTNAANPPTGYEMGSSATGSGFTPGCKTGATAADWVGIVPYKTLNIPVDWVRDAWGHYITYAVSPDFTQDPNNAALSVHAACRTADWYATGIVYEQNQFDSQSGQLTSVTDASGHPAPVTLVTKNARKARFCCPGLLPPSFGNDLQIMDGKGNTLLAIARQPAPPYTPPAVCANGIKCDLYETADKPYARETDATNAQKIPVNTITPNTQVTADQRPTASVYVLVSHGKNGYGAYISNGVNSRVDATAATPHEQANANGSRTYYDAAKADRQGAEEDFDDIALWRTQDAMFAERGQSCALP